MAITPARTLHFVIDEPLVPVINPHEQYSPWKMCTQAGKESCPTSCSSIVVGQASRSSREHGGMMLFSRCALLRLVNKVRFQASVVIESLGEMRGLRRIWAPGIYARVSTCPLLMTRAVVLYGNCRLEQRLAGSRSSCSPNYSHSREHCLVGLCCRRSHPIASFIPRARNTPCVSLERRRCA